MSDKYQAQFAGEDRPAFEQLLHQMYGERRALVDIQEQPNGPQGFSGSQICYFTLTSEDQQGAIHYDSVVTKSASLLERRVLHQLSSQGCAVPPVVILDITSDESRRIYMPFLEARPPFDLGHPLSPLTHSMADGLAGIHAANRGRRPVWLPLVSDDFLGRLWLHGWRKQWDANMLFPEFAAEFGGYTDRLEAAMDQLLKTLQLLNDEGDSLTLLNIDLIPDHIRLWLGSACFIDWQQAAYGSFYLDLPNPFNVETALVYRDALARHGISIPVLEFQERFHEIGRYMGLRYLEYALWQWAQGEKSASGDGGSCITLWLWQSMDAEANGRREIPISSQAFFKPVNSKSKQKAYSVVKKVVEQDHLDIEKERKWQMITRILAANGESWRMMAMEISTSIVTAIHRLQPIWISSGIPISMRPRWQGQPSRER